MSSNAGLVRGLAAVTTAGMFVVLVMGAAVTNTGSAEGCGRSWPLCNGQFVPEFTVSTAIEYSHRAVTGAEGLLVLALTVAMLAMWRRQREVTILAILMLGTLLLQAGLGAGAVLVPQSPLMLATHFGVSLVAFASTFLSARLVFDRTRGADQFRARATVGLPSAASVDRVPELFRRWVVGVGLYVLLVVYLGAYVRHAGVSLACADWPLCNGQLIPAFDFEGPSGIVFAHRLAALGAVLLIALLVRQARVARLGELESWAALGLVVLQALSGALVVWTRLGLFSALAHAAIMALLFAALAQLVWLAVASRERNGSVADRYPLSDGTARNLQPPPAETSRPHVLAAPSPGIATAGEHEPVGDARHGQRAIVEPADSRG